VEPKSLLFPYSYGSPKAWLCCCKIGFRQIDPLNKAVLAAYAGNQRACCVLGTAFAQ
jgi:hypothetical protein